MAKEKSNRREFVQLADTYKADKHKIAGMLISEKLDGMRCFWDGGITRGVKTEEVPWAGVLDPKTGNRKAKVKPYATGLWSRYGNPIAAPDDFLNALPACPLDGELWAGRETFQTAMSICRGDEPDPRFHVIQYAVYSAPALPYVFASGEIKNAQMVCSLDWPTIEKWIKPRLANMPGFGYVEAPATFNDELMFLREFLETQNDRVFIHKQIRLSENEDEARQFANEMIEKVLDGGGEGCVIRDPNAIWTPKRHKGLLKFKPYEDSEGVIVGFIAGEVGKKGERLGKIGALVVKWSDKEFKVASGLSGKTWEFKDQLMVKYASEHPGELMPANFEGKTLGKGDTITFKYRELTDDGIPKEGRFWRKRESE